MKTLEILLREGEAKMVLEALLAQEQQLLSICETSSADEDAAADAGNDLIELRLFLNGLRERAIDAFGSGVVNFSREQL
jgi:hypothetical protein